MNIYVVTEGFGEDFELVRAFEVEEEAYAWVRKEAKRRMEASIRGKILYTYNLGDFINYFKVIELPYTIKE